MVSSATFAQMSPYPLFAGVELMIQDLTPSNLLVDDEYTGGSGMRLLLADPGMAKPISRLTSGARCARSCAAVQTAPSPVLQEAPCVPCRVGMEHMQQRWQGWLGRRLRRAAAAAPRLQLLT